MHLSFPSKKTSKHVNFDTHVRIVAYGKILSKCESLKKKTQQRCGILKPQFYLLRWITHPDLKCVPSCSCTKSPICYPPTPRRNCRSKLRCPPHTRCPLTHPPLLPNVAFHSTILIFKSIF